MPFAECLYGCHSQFFGNFFLVKNLFNAQMAYFFHRALFDRSAHSKEELSFRKGDILYVTDTLNQGQLGVWKAWLVCENDESQKKEYGTIPSRTK